jgi:hypothetical protein
MYFLAEALVSAHVHYDIPYVLEAATAILLHHARTGERLYTDDPYTYTRCQDRVGSNNYPVFVGGFSSEGLHVSYNRVYDYDRRGVSCLRKF